MGLVEGRNISIPNHETLHTRSLYYDLIREFVDFPPAGVHQGFPDYDQPLRPHRRAKDTILILSDLTLEDRAALYSAEFLSPESLSSEAGAVIKLHSPEDPIYPNGIWISYFDPRAEKYTAISRPRGCITTTGEIQTLDDDEILTTDLTEKQFFILAKAISQGRIQPCKQAVVDKFFHNTVFRKQLPDPTE
jgi:hypothetical protein